MQLRFTSLTVTSSREDLHLQEYAHAGRTIEKDRRLGQHHAAIDFAQSGVGQAFEYTADVLVALVVTIAGCAGEADLLGCVQKLLQLRNGCAAWPRPY